MADGEPTSAPESVPVGREAATAPGLDDSHTGLRGLLAMWIVLFHAVIYSLGWNLHGSAIMPVFFLLAGYSLAIRYGSRQAVSGRDDGERTGSCGRFPVGRYLRNRFARIAPIYYATMLLALPPALFSQSWVAADDIVRVVMSNVVAVQMWSGLPPQSFVGPAWTISTLFFFYLAFPWLLRLHRRQDDRALSRWIAILFIVQACVYFALSFGIGAIDLEGSFWAAHAWPLSRLPVFDMGIVAGLLVLRQRRAERDRSIRFMGVPIEERGAWAGRTDRRAAAFAALIIGLSAFSVARVDLWGSWWVQGIFPYLMLQIIVGLSMAEGHGRSVTRELLTTRPLLFLGRVSLSLYLVHEVVIYYLKWLLEPDRQFSFAILPPWGIAVVVLVSIPLATVLEWAVERPGRRLLRSRPRVRSK